MTDAATKLRQFHSTTPVWAKEDRAVLLASADHIEAQAERIRVLREALWVLAERIRVLREALWVLAEHNELYHGKAHNTVELSRATLEATK